MQKKALKTLMMVSEQTIFQRNWELSPQEITLEPQPKNNNNNWSFYRHRNPKPKPQPKQLLSENKLQLISKQVSFGCLEKQKLTHTEVITNKKSFLHMPTKVASKNQFSHIFRKRYLLQNYKTLTRCQTVYNSTLSENKTKSQLQFQACKAINTMPVDFSQTHHCFKNEIIKELLNHRKTEIPVLKSKTRSKASNCSVMIYARKKHSGKEREWSGKGRQDTDEMEVSAEMMKSGSKKSKAFYVKNFLSRSQPKYLNKVHSLSIM